MVNTSEYVSKNEEYITVEEVTSAKSIEDKRCVIKEEAYFYEYPEKTKSDGTKIAAAKKLIVPVTYKGKKRFLRLNKIANTNLIAELGTAETADWVGATIQLGIAGTGMPYISATVINLPNK